MFRLPWKKKIRTVIGPETVIHGSLRFAHGAHVAGTVLGHVLPRQPRQSTRLSVDQGAIIHGTVSATDIELRGQVHGDVEARRTLLLGVDAQVLGKLNYDEILLETHPPTARVAAVDSGSDTASRPRPVDPRFDGILQILREPSRKSP